jgi:hypothetical protein
MDDHQYDAVPYAEWEDFRLSQEDYEELVEGNPGDRLSNAVFEQTHKMMLEGKRVAFYSPRPNCKCTLEPVSKPTSIWRKLWQLALRVWRYDEN